MKKHTTRLTVLTLACVSFLMTGTAIVNADNPTTTTSTTESSIIEDSSLDTKDTDEIVVDSPEKNTKKTTENSTSEKEVATPLEVSTKKLTGSEGKIELAKIGTVQPEGEFKPFENEFIKVEKDGSWTALKDGKTDFSLDYTLSQGTIEKIQKENPDFYIENPGKTETLTANITAKEKEVANISLEIIGGLLTSVEETKENGKPLRVQIKGGDIVTGSFKPVDSKTFVLSEEGYYSIPKDARNQKLNENVEFKLDDESYNKLANSDIYKDKTVERTYAVNVAKKAQKDIQIRFKNKGITTVIGGQGRLLLEDSIIDTDTKKEVKLVDIEKAKFKELKDNDFLTIDELGNWKALKAGEGPLIPAVVLADTTIAALEKEYSDFDLNITSETLKVTISQSGGGGSGTNNKKYEPVKTLPQTGEEKMKFAGTIGAIIIALAGVIYYFKKKKVN